MSLSLEYGIGCQHIFTACIGFAQYDLFHLADRICSIGSRYADVVLREALHQSLVANILPQHSPVRPLLGAIKLGKPEIGQIQQAAATALLLSSIYLIRYLQSLGAGTLRIGENVQAAERNLLP